MFAEAYKIARSYTRPVVMSYRTPDGKCGSSIGAFVVLNKDGWCLTAAHILDKRKEMATAQANYSAFLEEKKKIEGNPNLNAKARKKRFRALTDGKKLLSNHSDWWSVDGVKMAEGQGLAAIDLAVVRLEPFDPDAFEHYPVIKDPTRGMNPGTSLCRLGYPFHRITPTFDETRGFLLPKDAVPLPVFPIEGIFTRNVHVRIDGVDDRPAFPLQLVETSSPGLRGQSGGPIFDTRGTIWGIQSQTISLPLDIEARVEDKNGKPIIEHQVLNAGLGVHPVSLCGFLDEIGVNYKKSDY